MHHIDAQITGADNAQQGVHVGTIAIDQSAGIMDDLDCFHDLLFKETEGIGVGDHQASQGVVCLGFDGFKVNIPVTIGGDFDDLEAAHGGTGRVCAVGRIRNEHLGALRVAVVLMVGGDDLDADHFSLGAGCGLHGNTGKAADFLSHS